MRKRWGVVCFFGALFALASAPFVQSCKSQAANPVCPAPTPPPKYDFEHLVETPDQLVFGPIQDDEAVALYGIVRVMRPKVIVEFGTATGYSARNFVKAMDPDGRLYTYDLAPTKNRGPQHVHYVRDMASFAPSDVGNQKIGLVFMDAHALDAYKKVFRTLESTNILADDALIVVHDTGAHAVPMPGIGGYVPAKEGGFLHQAGDRDFVNWIKDNYPQFEQIHLHSRTFPHRHGLTILQKHLRLEPRDPPASPQLQQDAARQDG
jgi:predicted O-methyltransferase YrrM